jgi:hypothetical protein
MKCVKSLARRLRLCTVGLEDCAGANLPPDVADCKLDNGVPLTRFDKRYNRTVRK